MRCFFEAGKVMIGVSGLNELTSLKVWSRSVISSQRLRSWEEYSARSFANASWMVSIFSKLSGWAFGDRTFIEKKVRMDWRMVIIIRV